jgi:hypothetical protein
MDAHAAAFTGRATWFKSHGYEHKKLNSDAGLDVEALRGY